VILQLSIVTLSEFTVISPVIVVLDVPAHCNVRALLILRFSVNAPAATLTVSQVKLHQ
jgi:hypothetical protein